MKPSYFKTPRTLDESTFYSWGDPYDRPYDGFRVYTPRDKAFFALTVVAILATVALFFYK